MERFRTASVHGQAVSPAGSAVATAVCKGNRSGVFAGFTGSNTSFLLTPQSVRLAPGGKAVRVGGVDRGSPSAGEVFAAAYCR